MTESNDEIEREFGEFGEIAIKNCFLCGKTVRKKNCYEFNKTYPGGMGSGAKHNICLKCLLKGIYTICPDKQQLNKYIDLFTKIAISEELNKQTNQKV